MLQARGGQALHPWLVQARHEGSLDTSCRSFWKQSSVGRCWMLGKGV